MKMGRYFSVHELCCYSNGIKWTLLVSYLLFSIALSISFLRDSSAQVTTAITSDGSLGTIVNQVEEVHNITGGTRPGDGPNLFHSFGQFDVGTGDFANFLNETNLPTENILSRVTGGNPSQIFGTIQTTDFGNANLFLMNPAGVLFGPTASLNVGGSFHVTTADYLSLGEHGFFYEDLGKESVLTIDPPVAFGFLNENPIGITLEQTTLEVPAGQDVSVIGGNIEVVGRDAVTDPGVNIQNVINAPSGQITLVSANSVGEVSFNDVNEVGRVNAGSIDLLGHIELTKGARVTVAGDPAGTIVIRSGQLFVTDSFLTSTNIGAQDHSGIAMDIHVRDEIRLTAQEGFASIAGSSEGAGKAGNISIEAKSLEITGRPGLFDVNIGSRSFKTDAPAGDAGKVSITTESLDIRDFAFVSTQTFGPGKAGDILIRTENLQVLGDHDWAAIISSTGGQIAGGSGDGGVIDIQAQSILARGGPGALLTGIASNAIEAEGNGGAIRIRADGIELLNGAQINAGVFRGSGVGGSIDVGADRLIISGTDPGGAPSGIFSSLTFPGTGQSGDIQIRSQDITLENFGQVSSFSSGSGNSGNISINTDDLSVTNGAFIASTNFGTGLAGRVTVQADTILLQGPTNPPQAFTTPGIFAIAGATAQSAGNITVDTEVLHILDGAQVVGRTNGPGPGGTITIASEDVRIGGTDPLSGSFEGPRAGIFASTIRFPGLEEFAMADAGNVNIETQTLTLFDQGTIQAFSGSPGKGGTIGIAADTVTLQEGAFITTESTFSGNAGSINVDAHEVSILGIGDSNDPFGVDFTGFSTRTVSGHGGNVDVTADNLIVADKGLITAATGGAGQAGNVAIELNETLKVSTGGAISASTSGTGKGGTITVQAEAVALSEFGEFLNPDDQGASVISSQTLLGGGDAGNIVIDAQSVDVFDGAKIVADTLGTGQGGSISITGDEIQIAGVNEGLQQRLSQIQNISAKTIDQSPRSSVSATASGTLIGESATGKAGNVQISGGTVHVTNGGLVTSETTSAGTGGTVTLTGSQVILGEQALVSAQSSVFPGAGSAGDVEIRASENISGSSATVTSSAEQAAAGNVTITAGGDILFNGQTLISTETLGNENAGDVQLEASNSIILNNSTVSTLAKQADGGNIKITASELIQLTDSQVTSSVGGGPTTVGGNINVDPQFIILQNSQILAQAFAGQGGDITLTAGVVLADSFSTINASSDLGINGSVNIQASIQQLSETVAPLPEAIVSVAALYAQQCAAQMGGQFSSFVLDGGDGIPLSPGGFLLSPHLLQVPAKGNFQAPNFTSMRLGLNDKTALPEELERNDLLYTAQASVCAP